MTKIYQPGVNAGFARLYTDSEVKFPACTAGVADIAVNILMGRASLAQLQRVELDDMFVSYALRKLSASYSEYKLPNIDEAELRQRMRVCRDLTCMAILGATVGHKFDKITINLPSDTMQGQAWNKLSAKQGKGDVLGLLVRAARSISPKNEKPSLDEAYRLALIKEPSELFPGTGGMQVQRNKLMEHVETRLRQGFEGDSSAEAQALIHNLLITPGYQDID